MRKGLKRLLLAAAASLSLFGCSGKPTQPLPQPEYECIPESAVSYAAEKGLSFLPVSRMDETEGCMTREEQRFLDLLAYAYEHHYTDRDSLEEIINAFPTIGPATVNALAFSLIGFENDRAALAAGGGSPDDLGPFTVSSIGIFPVHDNQFVKTLTVNGVTYTAPILLERFGLPSAFALPENNPDILPANAYPPFPETDMPGVPDWANMDDTRIVNAFTLLGCSQCVSSENAPFTSFDLSLLRGWRYDPEAERIVYEIKERQTFFASLAPAVVTQIYADTSYQNPDPDLIKTGVVPHMTFEVRLRQKIDPRDYPLYGDPTIPYIDYVFVHVLPRLAPDARASDFPFKEGDILEPGERIGIIDPYLGPAFELDLNYSIPRSTQLAQHFGLPQFPEGFPEEALLDWLISKLYEEGVRSAPSPYPQGYLFYRPTNPRYTHGPGGMKNLGVWRPLAVDWSDGDRHYLNLP